MLKFQDNKFIDSYDSYNSQGSQGKIKNDFSESKLIIIWHDKHNIISL